MNKFYKFTIDEGIKYFIESHFGVPNATDKDIKDLGGWQFLSTLYTVIHLCEEKAKTPNPPKHIYICDPEGSCGYMDKKPDASFDFASLVDPDFRYAVSFYVNGHNVNWLNKLKAKSPAGTSIYDFCFGHSPHSSALSMTFYFE